MYVSMDKADVELERLKLEAKGELEKISIYDEIRIYLSLLSENITKYEWSDALKNINSLQAKIISLFLNRGMDVVLLNQMFDDLTNTVKSSYDTIGNNTLKRDDCFKQLNDIVNYIGSCGVYVGQQNITVYDYHALLDEKIKELTRMLYDATKYSSMMDTFIMTCEFLRYKIIPYMEVPSEVLRYRVIEALNTIISSLSLSKILGSSASKTLERAFSELRNYVDIILLSNRNPEFKKFFEEHKEEFELAGEKEIEKTVEKVVKKILNAQGE